MATDAEVTFRQAEWSDETERELARIEDVTPRDIEVFRQQVQRGAFNLMDILADGRRVGLVIWSVETELDGFSLVMNATSADPVAGVDLADTVADKFEQTARACGARAVRCWTSRPGLVRKMEMRGASRRYAMEKVLT